MKPLASFLFAALLLASARGAALERDLGSGLGYIRAHTLPAELPSENAKNHALVLDLRFAAATDPEAATLLAAWLKFRATSAGPAFVLLNAGTAPALRRVFAVRHPGGAVITLGPTLPDYVPDIVLTVDDATERRAYDALETGATVASLMIENADKPRHDEAALAREHAAPPADQTDADPVEGAAADANANPTPAAPAPPPTVDLSLQRAVQLHRTLLALRRL